MTARFEDEAFLGEVLDDALNAWSRGSAPEPERWIRLRPDLRHRIEQAIAVAREVAPIRPIAEPSVTGYRVLREIGRGGMGVVYLAVQIALERRVALKVVAHASLESERARSRFLSEAKLLARVRHPNVLHIYEVIESDRSVAFSCEWIDGLTLSALMRVLLLPRSARQSSLDELLGEEHSIPVDDSVVLLCRVGIAVARALAAVHAAGLVHRDVKPGNILIRRDGTPLLGDFGLACDDDLAPDSQSGSFVGTATYAAPEQLRGDLQQVNATADVYALGATLYHALAGHPPRKGRTASELITASDVQDVVPLMRLGLPRDLDTIVRKCLSPNAADRYPSADAVADDLERLLALRPIRAQPPSLLRRVDRLVRRNRVIALAACLGRWWC